MEQIATGAFESDFDARTVQLDDILASPLVSGGIDYLPGDIENQHKVGICTAISRVQLREKQTGKKYSPEFQYLCQKVFYDNNWQEGSSILNANKVAKNIGFLPLSLFPYVTESDRLLSYSAYVAKLQAIPTAEIERLMTLCVDKIMGYGSVNVSNPQSIAKAIDDSEAGILCRYDIGEEWWTPSWQPKDIDPLRAPMNPSSGHAIIMSKFDYSVPLQQKLANTWGIDWDLQGSADINWNNYKPTEAWADLAETPVIVPIPLFHHNFALDLKLGATGAEVMALQDALRLQGTFPQTIASTGYFGGITLSAVKGFQAKYAISPRSGFCGPITRSKLNELYNH